jgi:HSP20 family protein
MTNKLIPWRKRHTLATGQEKDQPILTLQRQMNQLFDEMLGDVWGGGFRWPAPVTWERQTDFISPKVDIAETDEEIQVSADLPGLDEKDITVTVDENLLTIQGEKKAEHEEQQKNYHLMERSCGAFQRSIALPLGVDSKKIKATFKKGVLRITLPKLPEARAQRKQITVETG